MNDLATKIQKVINTLGLLQVPAIFENVNRLTGIYITLNEVMDALSAEELPEETGEAVE